MDIVLLLMKWAPKGKWDAKKGKQAPMTFCQTELKGLLQDEEVQKAWGE